MLDRQFALQCNICFILSPQPLETYHSAWTGFELYQVCTHLITFACNSKVSYLEQEFSTIPCRLKCIHYAYYTTIVAQSAIPNLRYTVIGCSFLEHDMFLRDKQTCVSSCINFAASTAAADDDGVITNGLFTPSTKYLIANCNVVKAFKQCDQMTKLCFQ